MSIAIGLALALVVVCFLFHYSVLLWLSRVTPRVKVATTTQVLIIVLCLFVAHLIEIGLYAAVYAGTVNWLELGEFTDGKVADAMSYLYYSGVIYTTLGLGDIEPIGHIRFITATEALNGFLLITWSASFTFLAMGRLWPWTHVVPAQQPSSTYNHPPK
mgnify:FL=1|jgi:hypothetical protein